jgi:hypothetical protein
MVAMAVVGGFRNYSPVPFWDMWDGTVNFYLKASQGNLSAWWEQHNEHRIVLSRLLFYIDMRWLGGTGWFLIFVNYLLVGVSCIVFIAIFRRSRPSDSTTIIAMFFIIGWLFSWAQKANLTQAFQSQFILAQLLPLCAFYWLFKSTIDESKSLNFFIACALGISAIGSMANGVLTLPLMLLYALITRQNGRRLGVLFFLSVLCITAYFQDYHAPQHHGSLLKTVTEHPLIFFHYLLLYLGNPFYDLFSDIGLAHEVTALAGMVLIAGSVYYIIGSLRDIENHRLELMLLTFLLYIGGTSIATAGGRALFGVDQALSSRYVTPMLMAWASLIILASRSSFALSLKNTPIRAGAMLCLCLLCLGAQTHALRSRADIVFERELGALALELHVNDASRINKIYPFTERALVIADRASQQNLSVFGSDSLKDKRESIGRIRDSPFPTKLCSGSVDQIEDIEEDPNYLFISGQASPLEKTHHMVPIQILTPQRRIVGYAVLGYSRNEHASSRDGKMARQKFQGYLLKKYTNRQLVLTTTQPSCKIITQAPPLYFHLRNKELRATATTVDSTRVLPGNEWTGRDFYQTDVSGFQVYGSYISSDADTGSINIKLHRGDKLFYRSGPQGEQQYLHLKSKPENKIRLPIATDWVLLDFDTSYFTESSRIVTLTDGGSGWGEWSAIAIRSAANMEE